METRWGKRFARYEIMAELSRGAMGTLLLFARFGKEGKHESVVPKISQKMLAEMIGTTRSRVSFFMNRFRKLGFVHYKRWAASPQFAA